MNNMLLLISPCYQCSLSEFMSTTHLYLPVLVGQDCLEFHLFPSLHLALEVLCVCVCVCVGEVESGGDGFLPPYKINLVGA